MSRFRHLFLVTVSAAVLCTYGCNKPGTDGGTVDGGAEQPGVSPSGNTNNTTTAPVVTTPVATNPGNANNPNTPPAVVDTTPIPVPVCQTGVPFDVNIVVTSKLGPKNFAAPVKLTNNLYSMGIDDRTRGDYFPSLDSNFVAYLKGLHPAYLRFPAGHNGQNYFWSTTAKDGFGVMTPKLMDAFIALCRATNSEPYIAVNIDAVSGSVEDATAYITYANKTKNYNVKWWQIGNEPNLGSTATSQTQAFKNYPQTYLTYRNALRSVDPTIKTVGLESYQGMQILREYTSNGSLIDRGEPDFFSPFLAAVGNQVDAIAWHYYQLYSGDASRNTNASSAVNAANLFQEAPSDWPPAGLTFADKIIPFMREKMKATLPNAEIWIDEFAEDSGNQLAGRGVADTLAGALWAADITGRYADQGTDGIFHFIFKAAGSPSLQFGYTLLDNNNVPRPEYYAYWLMANHYADQMVRTSTSAITQVASHAAVSSTDGSLHVMLVNKSNKAQAVRLTLPDFTPVRAKQYVLTGPSLSATTATINGKTLTPDVVTLGDAAVASQPAQACADNTFTVPAYSVAMVVFTNK